MMKKTEKDLKEIKEGLAQEKLISGAPKMLQVLKYLDAHGGLGLDKHALIKEAIDGATLED